MAWGDSWGSSPCNNALRLAKAFFEGRELGGNSKTRVQRVCGNGLTYMEYLYKRKCIARYTPPEIVAAAVAMKLTLGVKVTTYPEMVVQTYWQDKGEARHLKALGVDATWQWGGKPFLLFGAEAPGTTCHTIEELKALPKWIEPPKSVRIPPRQRFVNLTLPLPGFA